MGRRMVQVVPRSTSLAMSDLALVLVNEAPADGQAQTGAPGLGGEKWGEEVLQVFRGDALAGVGDFEDQVVVPDCGADGKSPPWGMASRAFLKRLISTWRICPGSKANGGIRPGAWR